MGIVTVKKALLSLVLLALGVGTGGGSAFLGSRLLNGKPLMLAESPKIFLPTGPVTIPLVSSDGRLSGYILVESQLEVPGYQLEGIRTRLPLLLDAITMHSFKAPMASGPDGMLPNLDGYRSLLQKAVTQVYGTGAVSRIVVTKVLPI